MARHVVAEGPRAPLRIARSIRSEMPEALDSSGVDRLRIGLQDGLLALFDEVRPFPDVQDERRPDASSSEQPPNWFISGATLITAALATAMVSGYGRGRFGERTVTMNARSVRYGHPVESTEPNGSDKSLPAREASAGPAGGDTDER